MARKIVIEIEDSEYAELVDLYKEFQKNNPQLANEVKFEGFVASIIHTNLEAKRQMDKMGDSFKSMMEMFNSSDMEAMLKSFTQNMQKAKDAPKEESKKTESDSSSEQTKTDSNDNEEQSYKS